MKKVLFIGDGVVPTGFSTVLHNIISNLPKEEFDVHHLAINYYGDPHDKYWKIYPAMLGGDIWGFGRLNQYVDQKFDGIFILNDVWVIDNYLKKIKEVFKNKDIPPIVVYFPVDSKYLDAEWFNNFDIVSKTVVYTKFGYKEVKTCKENLEPLIISHGVNSNEFYKLDSPKRELKAKIYPNREDFLDSFVVLNANRNQPRKRIDLTLQAFKLFSDDKPSNVKLYCHMGSKDMGWNIFKLAFRYGIEKRLIVTNTLPNLQVVTTEKLNLIYNASDVGMNTAAGEGWSLTNMEHAVTGAPQVVPNHSALTELYHDIGLLIPIDTWVESPDTLTISGIIKPEAAAERLQLLYENRDLFNKLSQKSIEKFTQPEYNWKVIVEEKWLPLFREIYDRDNLAQ
jgi:D-inositol-3-phosphate glycosyltransferase